MTSETEQPQDLTAEEQDRERRLRWFRAARFGMFIHWGLYAQLGRHEWVMNRERIPVEEYEKLAESWKPEPNAPRRWAKLARQAGMRYMVMTTKHHEGFCLFDSKLTDYCAPKRGPKRDLVAEYVDAARAEGLRVGFYYSHWLDWEHPGGALPPWPEMKDDPPLVQPSQEAYEQYWTGKCLPQVRELLVNFEPDFLWFDSWGKATTTFLTKDRLDRLISHPLQFIEYQIERRTILGNDLSHRFGRRFKELIITR